MARRTKNNTEFGTSVSKALAEANLRQNDLANRIDASPSHLNQMMTGRKTASPEWVDLVATALNLQAEQRGRLHTAAARDAGYKVLDLTKK